MNLNDCSEYWYPACKNLFGSSTIATAKQLDRALGSAIFSEYLPRPLVEDFPLNDEMKMLLTKLAGPHGKTLLRAYRARKGLE